MHNKMYQIGRIPSQKPTVEQKTAMPSTPASQPASQLMQASHLSSC